MCKSSDIVKPLEIVCPLCSGISTIRLSVEESYLLSEGIEVCKALSKRNAFEREVVISGMCFSCQERVFNKPSPEHQTDWGEYVGECPCCDTTIWSKKNLTPGGYYLCPSCGSIMLNVNGALQIEYFEDLEG